MIPPLMGCKWGCERFFDLSGLFSLTSRARARTRKGSAAGPWQPARDGTKRELQSDWEYGSKSDIPGGDQSREACLASSAIARFRPSLRSELWPLE